MSCPVRLVSISPELADSFERATEPQQRQAVEMACLTAMKHTGLQGTDVDSAIQLIRAESANATNVRLRIRALSETLDREYFELNEAEPNGLAALARFRQARAAAALAFGLSPQRADLHEAVYEAIVAAAQQLEIIQATEATLKESP